MALPFDRAMRIFRKVTEAVDFGKEEEPFACFRLSIAGGFDDWPDAVSAEMFTLIDGMFDIDDAEADADGYSYYLSTREPETLIEEFMRQMKDRAFPTRVRFEAIEDNGQLGKLIWDSCQKTNHRAE